MPCFYLRNQASIALFKLDAKTGTPVAELIPSMAMTKTIKEKANLQFSVTNIYEEDEDMVDE